MLKIAVIGSGIAGPAASLFLKRLDAKVTVFDKVKNLTPVGAGFLLQPAGLDVLNQLGLAESLITQGAPIVGLRGLNHRDRVVLDLRYSDLVPHHIGLGMHRATLYHAIFQQMRQAGIQIINPCEIAGIEQFADKVILHDALKQQYGPYDCVVLADGSRSLLREKLQIKTRVSSYDWGALWAIGTDRDNRYSNCLEQIYQHTEVMLGILPMRWEDSRLLLSFFWSLKKSRLQQWLDTPLDDWFCEILALCPQLASFLEQFNHHRDFAFASYQDVKVYPWHDNRVVLIGDTAHGMSPQLGQGANLGLLDAKILYDCLSTHAVPQALALYTQKRKKQLRYYQQASRFVTPWFQSSHYSMGLLRDLLHGLFCKTPVIKKQMLLTLACMKTGYFSSTSLDAFKPILPARP